MTIMVTFSDRVEGGLSSSRRGDGAILMQTGEGTLMVGNLLYGGDVL